MIDLTDLTALTPKKLRTLRNNLNNRLESYKTHGKSTKELQKSHMLAGLSDLECEKLLRDVNAEIRRRGRGDEGED